MTSGKQRDCGCGRGLGLDELMIVNPGSKDETRASERFFLGDDGTLYHADELAPRWIAEARTRAQATIRAHVRTRELHGYFLGADGTLYEVVG